MCDRKCDCVLCDDEAKCHNITVGIFCRNHDNKNVYIQPSKLCIGIGLPAICANGFDVAVCRDTTETCYGHANRFRVLTPWSKCSLPDSVFKMCDKQRDQMNCTFSTISPLTCNVNGYPTTISLHVICKNFALCDDKLDDVCIEAEFHCKIHKHQLCDGIGDCNDRHDESKFFCEDLVPTEIGCVRRLSYNKSATKIPRQWILDGVVDCMNSIFCRVCNSFLNWLRFYLSVRIAISDVLHSADSACFSTYCTYCTRIVHYVTL